MGGIVNAVADVVGLGPASKQSKATTQAADTSAAAARYAADLQKQMFDKQLELQAPFRASGLAAQNRLNELLGLGPRYDQSFANFNAGAYLNANPDAKAWVASKSMMPGANAEKLAYEHFVADGSRRTGDFFKNTLSPNYGKYARDFSMQDFQIDPGYAFRMSEGLK